MGEGKKL